MANSANVSSILVFRSGLLGDTLVALPTLWCLRNAYPDAWITYVFQNVVGRKYVSAPEVLGNTGLVNDFEAYDTGGSCRQRIFAWFRLLVRLRRRRWDLAIILEEPHWNSLRRLFALCCTPKRLISPSGNADQVPRDPNGALARLPHIADTLLELTRPLGLSLPRKGAGRFDLGLKREDHQRIDRWLTTVNIASGQGPWIAVAPWSNMPAKRWPLERYRETVHILIKEFDVTPLVFGGADERDIGLSLVESWGRGYAVCGELSVRDGVGLLSRCAIYLGNDTGTMHMAASAGTRCVAIFSSRDAHGRWEPYGAGHVVLRTPVACEGCMLRECEIEDMRCIKSISVPQVVSACHSLLSRIHSSPPVNAV